MVRLLFEKKDSDVQNSNNAAYSFKHGVPQRQILNLLLFLCYSTYLKDVPKSVPAESAVFAYLPMIQMKLNSFR